MGGLHQAVPRSIRSPFLQALPQLQVFVAYAAGSPFQHGIVFTTENRVFPYEA